MVHLPSLFSNIPREPLLYTHPSPIEPLSRLTSCLFPPSRFPTKLWIKREDSNSGLATGGNKIRKLEYVLADALASSADVLVTTGGLQSNHMRQTAAAAARCGLKCHLIPQDRKSSVAPEYKTLGNVQITHLLGATHHPPNSDVETVLKNLKDQGDIPYWIPSGASTHPLGGLGYARFAFEILEQEHEMGLFFDVIIVACASGSTLGGMIAGFKLIARSQNSSDERDAHLRIDRTIIGIDCFAHEPGKSAKEILKIARTTGGRIGLLEEDINEEDVVVDERWNGGKYGFLDDGTREGINKMAGAEGILTDPVYSGKAVTGLIGMAMGNELDGRGNVLFVHTGGVSALSAYPDLR